MIRIEVSDIRLVYRQRQKLSLAMPVRQPSRDSRIVRQGRMNLISALDGVSFVLGPGDRLGLVGENGAGKSTLLKVLYGIYAPTGGTVRTEGRVDALFNINLGFRPEATGRRNIELRGLLNGWSRAEIADRMESIIEFSELEDFIDMPIKTYSQGMSARLAFATATALDPEILLLDEWIGAGDQRFRGKAAKRMNALSEKAGIVVLATHSRKLLQETCNKVLELEKGKVKGFYESIEAYEAAGDSAN